MSSNVYGRNYDFWPRGYEARFALVQATGSYASIGSSHQLTGRLDGMNDLFPQRGRVSPERAFFGANVEPHRQPHLLAEKRFASARRAKATA